MIRVTTESGRMYDIDLDGQFWGRSPNFYPRKTWALKAGSEKVLPWEHPEKWEDRLPTVGEHLYIGDRDGWFVSNKVVSIEEV